MATTSTRQGEEELLKVDCLTYSLILRMLPPAGSWLGLQVRRYAGFVTSSKFDDVAGFCRTLLSLAGAAVVWERILSGRNFSNIFRYLEFHF